MLEPASTGVIIMWNHGRDQCGVRSLVPEVAGRHLLHKAATPLNSSVASIVLFITLNLLNFLNGIIHLTFFGTVYYQFLECQDENMKIGQPAV